MTIENANAFRTEINGNEKLQQSVTEVLKTGTAEDLVNRGLSQNKTKISTATSYSHPYYWAPFILMGNWL